MSESLLWDLQPPKVAGLYCWSMLNQYCLFHVTDRGDGQLAVMPNDLPVTEYDGCWIGPIPQAPQAVIADRAYRDGAWRIATRPMPQSVDTADPSLCQSTDADGECSTDLDSDNQSRHCSPGPTPLGRVRRNPLGTAPDSNLDCSQSAFRLENEIPATAPVH